MELARLQKPPHKSIASLRMELQALKDQRELCAEDPYPPALVLGAILRAVRNHDPGMKEYAISLQQKKGLTYARALRKLEKYESNMGRKFTTEQQQQQQRRPRAYAMKDDYDDYYEPNELNHYDHDYEHHPNWDGEARAYQAGYQQHNANQRANNNRPQGKGRGRYYGEDKRNRPCPYKAQGHCKKGDRCDWSHDPALFGGERRAVKNTIGKPPADNAYMLREPNDLRDIMATLEMEESADEHLAYHLEHEENIRRGKAYAIGLTGGNQDYHHLQEGEREEWAIAYYDSAATKTYLKPSVFDRVFKPHQTERGTLFLNSANTTEQNIGRLQGTHIGGGNITVRSVATGPAKELRTRNVWRVLEGTRYC